jgi:hypothetical protein
MATIKVIEIIEPNGSCSLVERPIRDPGPGAGRAFVSKLAASATATPFGLMAVRASISTTISAPDMSRVVPGAILGRSRGTHRERVTDFHSPRGPLFQIATDPEWSNKWRHRTAMQDKCRSK